MNWTKYFEMLQDWKRLPAYRAEPRIDSLVGFYLPEFASDFLEDRIVGIIPELPIRLGTVRPEHEGSTFADKSYKVDFYLLGRSGTNYFVEFKTDSGSRRDEQDQYLTAARAHGMKAIVGGIVRIASVSSYKVKYSHLLAKLRELGLLDERKGYAGKVDTVEIVYVQPSGRTHDTARTIDFNWLSKWLSDKHGQGEYEVALAKTLSHWSKD